MGQQFTSIARGLNLGGFQESKEEFLEKGKKAQIGEIREWKGQKFQKQSNGGWIPVKQGTKDSKKEDFDWKKVTAKDMAGVPVGTKISFEDDLSGTRVVAEKIKDNSWKNDEGNTFTDEEMAESVTHADAHDHKIEKPSTEKKEKKSDKEAPEIGKKGLTEDQQKFIDRFFDPQEMVNGFGESFDLLEGVEGFSSWLNDRQSRDLAIDALVDQTGMSQKEAMKLYDERTAAVLEEVKKNPERYGFETSNLNKKVLGVKDWIDDAKDQEISDVLDAVEDFVPEKLLDIGSVESPVEEARRIYDRADEIMDDYREHFDHWDGTDSMPDKKLRQILVAIMYDKRNPRA